MKKSFVFIFFVVMVFNLSAKEHNLTVGISSGTLNGQAQEIVYIDSKSDTKLSELLWNFESLGYVGADIKYSWRKPEKILGLFVNGSYKYAYSGDDSVMEDRDWMYIDNAGNAYSSYPWLTHYSTHNNIADPANLIDFNLGMSILIFNKFLLKPYISYHYMHFSWTASGGSILYPVWDIPPPTATDHHYLNSVKVCTYEQTWNIFSPFGISFYGEFNRYFDIEIALEASPFIWCRTQDNHLLRNLVITEIPSGGVFGDLSLLFSYKPSEHFVLSLSFAYREINRSRGDSLYKEPSSSTLFKNGGGAGYSAVDVGIILKYKI